MKKKIYGILLSSLLMLCGCSQTSHSSSLNESISSSSPEKEFWKITEEEYAAFLKLCEETNFTFINTDSYYYNDKGEIGRITPVDEIVVFQFDFPNQRFSKSLNGIYSSLMPNPDSQDFWDKWVYGEHHFNSSVWSVSLWSSCAELSALPFPEYNELRYDNEKHAYGLTMKATDDSDRENTDYYYFENGKITKIVFDDWLGEYEFPYLHCTRYITNIGTTVIDVPDEETVKTLNEINHKS